MKPEATDIGLAEIADSLQHIIGWHTDAFVQNILIDCINRLRRLAEEWQSASLRDIFAGIAMHAIMSNMANLKPGVGLGKTAYEAADAMLTHRAEAGQGAA